MIDTLIGCYEIVHKLGHGSYSTVWLVRDHREAKNVAMKIQSADAPGNSSESEILYALFTGPQNHPGRANIPSILNDFFITGPNGRHLCIVTEIAGCSVAQ